MSEQATVHKWSYDIKTQWTDKSINTFVTFRATRTNVVQPNFYHCHSIRNEKKKEMIAWTFPKNKTPRIQSQAHQIILSFCWLCVKPLNSLGHGIRQEFSICWHKIFDKCVDMKVSQFDLCRKFLTQSTMTFEFLYNCFQMVNKENP